jgi:L-lactate dehydrogenase complex protein LldE
MKVALFVPCFVDQLYPRAAIAALEVLARLGLDVAVPDKAVCCGQPVANAGFEREGVAALKRFAETFAPFERTVVLSGSCAVHLRAHADARVAARTTELCAFLHDEVGLDAIGSLGAELDRRVALHIGCHALRSLGLACATELQVPPWNKVRALLETVRGITFAEPSRADECCGFGGTFSVTEPELSAKMGRDRLRDYRSAGVEAVVSTDMSCVMHLSGVARREGVTLPMLHVVEVLASRGAPRLASPASEQATGAAL